MVQFLTVSHYYGILKSDSLYGWHLVRSFFHHRLHPDGPVYCFMMQVGMIIGFATSYPVNQRLIRKGLKEKNVRKVDPLLLRLVMLRRYGAEFIGTFAYVFFGCGARLVDGNGATIDSRLAVYFTFGFTLFVTTYALSHISGAPFNPAVVLGLAVAKRFPWRYVWPYWLAQIAGALTASAFHFFLLPELARAGRYGATIPTIGLGQAVGIEAVITFFLMIVAMAAATERRVHRAVTGLATGLTITLCGLFASPLTGGSMNPARSLAPALFAGGEAIAVVWVYWVGPLAGAILGALVYERLRGGEEHALEVPAGIFDAIRHSPKTFSQRQDSNVE